MLRALRAAVLRAAPAQEWSQGAAATLLLRMAFVALEFLCSVAVARVFGISSYGIYAFAMSCVGLLGVPAALGFDRLLIREIATLRARGEWSQAHGLIRRSAQIVLAVSGVLALAVAAGVLCIADRLGHEMTVAVQLSMLIVPIVAYARVRQAALQGLGHVAAGQLPETLIQPLALLAAVGSVQILCPWPRSGTLAVALNIGAAAVACGVGLGLLRRFLPETIRAATCEYRTKLWIRSATPFILMLAMNVVLTYADTIIVGALSGPAAAAVYRVASQMAMLVCLPLTAINLAVAPALAASYARGDLAAMQFKASAAARAILVAALPVAIALLILGNVALSLFGAQFTAGYPALTILVIGYVINAAMGTSGYLLIMTKHENAAAVSFACAALLNVCGNLYLIPVWGTSGAAIATAVSVAFVSVVFAILAYRKLGIRAVVKWNGG